MTEERYRYDSRHIDAAERMQQAMPGFYDLLEEARDADFPSDLLGDPKQLRLRFMDEFERRFPGYGKGRAAGRERLQEWEAYSAFSANRCST